MRQDLAYTGSGALTLETSSEWQPEIDGDRLQLTGQFAWRFLGDWGDESSTLRRENREPQLRWALTRQQPEADEQDSAQVDTAVEATEPADEAPAHPWGGTWRVGEGEILGDRYLPRLQPAPTCFMQIVFGVDGSLGVTLPTGRIDSFTWELTEDERPTLRLTATGEFEVEHVDGTMRLTGAFRGHAVNVSLAERDLNEFQLLKRGFQWVNPIPWNRN